MVDGKMRAVSANGNTVDSLRVAVLAALNIATNSCVSRSTPVLLRGNMSETQTTLRSRANSLSGLLDSILDPEHRYDDRVPVGAGVNTGSHCQSASADVSTIQRPACKAGAAVNAG